MSSELRNKLIAQMNLHGVDLWTWGRPSDYRFLIFLFYLDSINPSTICQTYGAGESTALLKAKSRKA